MHLHIEHIDAVLQRRQPGLAGHLSQSPAQRRGQLADQSHQQEGLRGHPQLGQTKVQAAHCQLGESVRLHLAAFLLGMRGLKVMERKVSVCLFIPGGGGLGCGRCALRSHFPLDRDTPVRQTPCAHRSQLSGS